jgi:hypothetical protein
VPVHLQGEMSAGQCAQNVLSPGKGKLPVSPPNGRHIEHENSALWNCNSSNTGTEKQRLTLERRSVSVLYEDSVRTAL